MGIFEILQSCCEKGTSLESAVQRSQRLLKMSLLKRRRCYWADSPHIRTLRVELDGDEWQECMGCPENSWPTLLIDEHSFGVEETGSPSKTTM